MGWLMGLGISRFGRPPRGFRNTLLAATSMGNWGDLTLAVVLSLGESAPFKKGDSALGVAYVSAFLCFSNIFAFTAGIHWIGKDHAAHPEELASSTESDDSSIHSQKDVVVARSPSTSSVRVNGPTAVVELVDYPTTDTQLQFSSTSSLYSTHENGVAAGYQNGSMSPRRRVPILLRRWFRLSPKTTALIKAILNLANLSIIFGLIVAVVPFLRNLFIHQSTTPTPSTDHEPPLRFLYEVFDFVGAAGPPLGVLNLGAALGRLNVKTMLPMRLTIPITMVRLVILPILGIALTQVFTYHVGWIDREDKILRFILMFQGCVPTASATVFFTQMFSAEGEANEIAGVVLIQYGVAIVSLCVSILVIFVLLQS
ncbi:Protein M3 [Rhizophlyctis rosea]|uniref:Protein M3 n=1 Tax=Rhizophlyctis rosea TaxID=64517 RepID=A0AAD5SAN0_9FUNG|nr:Protein M3 [Rhizophlyctis rosea]